MAKVKSVKEYLDWIKEYGDIDENLNVEEQQCLQWQKEYKIIDEESCDKWYNSLLLEREVPEGINDVFERKLFIYCKLYSTDAIKEHFKHLRLLAKQYKQVFYRGHADKDWELKPSLYRKMYIMHEHGIYERALREHPQDFNSEIILKNLVLMQHHGMPTRLLDITSNPLVALYFACAREGELKDKNGKVFLFIETDPYDLQNAQLFSKFVKLESQNGWDGHANMVELLELDENEPIPKVLLQDKILYKPYKSNQRIIAQSGEFYIYGHPYQDKRENDLFDVPKKYSVQGSKDKIEIGWFTKNIKTISKETISIVIDAHSKNNILDELDTLNINQASLFPDLDNYCQYIKSKYQ